MKLTIIDNTTLETIDEYLEFKNNGKKKAVEFGEVIHSEILKGIFERYWVQVKNTPEGAKEYNDI